ncbi:MAG: alpha/beta fold hydrolase [Parasphingorhabdus sp.]|uniref:alpha/beta hydrolase n=1 Tax=Parasphingorhabdus sp. TaxID=2709688 RepID=UPI003003568C
MTFTVTDERLDTGGLTLSAIQGEPSEPALATIIALPGGGYNSAYWHHPCNRRGSLVELGASLGFRVFSVDRPGYGASSALFPDGCHLDRQLSLIGGLVDELSRAPGAGAGVFLVGHSMGGIVALRVAAEQPHGLLGLDVSGVPLRFSEKLASAVSANLDGDEAHSAGKSAAELFYGPPESYDAALLRKDVSLVPPPSTELADSVAWPSQFSQTASAIEVPVRITLGDHEAVTETGWPALHETAALFTRSPRVETALQAQSGHNVSLHYIARAFHLRALAFFEETLELNKQ